MSLHVLRSRFLLIKDRTSFGPAGPYLKSRKQLLMPLLSSQSPGPIVRCGSNAADSNLEDTTPPSPTVKVLYDGECNLCAREISLLRKVARQRPVHFVDINTAEFTAEKYGGVTYEMAMKEMHIIGADGKVHVQADAIREMYRACGLGWMAALTQLPGVDKAFDTLYLKFARYRLENALDRCDSGVSCSIKLKHLRDKLRSPSA